MTMSQATSYEDIFKRKNVIKMTQEINRGEWWYTVLLFKMWHDNENKDGCYDC